MTASNTPGAPKFERAAFIGFGLIGSSMARVMRAQGMAGHIAVNARGAETLAAAERLGLADSTHQNAAEAVRDADLVVLAAPVGAFAGLAEAMAPGLRAGAIVTDVGSVKASVIRDVKPHLPAGVHLVPGHPVAGTEYSGPEAGFAELFEGRWCILTPDADTDEAAAARIEAFWRAAGSEVTRMTAADHDRVLAVTSHLPHLIAYTICDTADQLGDDLKQQVIRYSAAGFRDFTRIAASDPAMWRDVFLHNRDAVLDILNRFDEDLTELKRAIRKGDGEKLFETFTRTRAIRRSVIDAKQDTEWKR
ncbi:MAG: prephenate/arogenate dehydrogenase family protein [Rhodospirillales bacterium]